MMAAHAALESARDALLLQSLSPSALLWSYVVIAAVALMISRLPELRPSLPLVLAIGAVLPIAFWFVLPMLGPLGAAVFYVYTAIYVTIAVPRFWLLLANRFTVGDAKRYYAWIGAGGIGGAAAGSAVSASLLTVVSVRDLLLVGAVFYGASAVVAQKLGAGAPPAKRTAAKVSRHRDWRDYLRRIVIASLLASATFTVIDYLFKSVAATTVPHEELASYFARVYTGMNIVALLAQIFVAPFLLRRLGTLASAAVLPTLLLASSAGFAALGWPLLALASRASDGALRNSLHRVTSELFYFPLSEDVRQRFKATTDAFGQRGGQALGALILLVLITAGGNARVVAALAAILAVAWLIVARSMRAPYAALFREGLRRGTMPVDVRPLASETLQAVLEAFSSPDPAIVCSAIDFLEHHGNARLLPSLVVHHPSQKVALRALEVLARSRQDELGEIARSLLRHADGTIRATALRLYMQQGRDPNEVLFALEDSSPDVRATAILVLLDSEPHRERASALLDGILSNEPAVPKVALARAIQADARHELIPVLLRLLDTPDLSVRRETLRALSLVPEPTFLPRLLPLLAERRLLPDVRRAILTATPNDSSVIEGWLRDETLDRGIRRHVPRTLCMFETSAAATALVERLEKEEDGAIRFKILRGLGRMRANRPTLELDEDVLRRYALECLDRAVRILAYRTALADGPEDPVQTLLVALLRDKELHALERVFRAIGVVEPELAMEDVWYGIHAADARMHDAALEVVDTLPPELRLRLVIMLQETPELEKLSAAGGETLSREQALEAMSTDRSRPLRELAAVLRRPA
jgi:AAA family ATP:ADP antiporter